MDNFKAQSAEVVIDGDVLTLTRKKIGADDVRRIPLAAVTDVRVKPGGRFAPALLQLVLNNEPPAEMSPNEQNTLLFPSTAKYKPAFDAPPAPAPPAQPDVLGQITKLGELHAAGVLTDEEFQAKKAQLLDRL